MISKTSQPHLRNIGNIRKFLGQVSAETSVHSFVKSNIDYYNVLCGIPKGPINKLQLVLNTAARAVTLARKYDHITSVMKLLHRLPVF